MHELLGGTGFAGQDDAFFDQVDFDVQLVQGDPVFEIAVEPIRLLDEQDANVEIRPQVRDAPPFLSGVLSVPCRVNVCPGFRSTIARAQSDRTSSPECEVTVTILKDVATEIYVFVFS